jgi:hypothetical protein
MQPNAICLASKQMMPANISKHSKVSKCKPASNTQVILGAKPRKLSPNVIMKSNGLKGKKVEKPKTLYYLIKILT